jgi:hypothetical protein
MKVHQGDQFQKVVPIRGYPHFYTDSQPNVKYHTPATFGVV